MSGVNKTFHIGNLGKDPQTYNNGGSPVCRFSIAIDKGKESRPEWIDIVTYEKTAELCQKYLKKGRKVHVEGHLKVNFWEDKDGKKRKSTDVVGDRVTFLGGERTEEPRPEYSEIITRTEDEDFPF